MCIQKFTKCRTSLSFIAEINFGLSSIFDTQNIRNCAFPNLTFVLVTIWKIGKIKGNNQSTTQETIFSTETAEIIS